ncbi:MAG: EamA family transporter [Phycisphaerales bacterium]|nr:EamA family transporter [Phycisphaerales bacterium]
MTTTTARPPTTAKIVIAFAIVYVVWGSTYLAIRFAVETIPPFLMAGVRFLIAGGILYTLTQWRSPQRLGARAWIEATINGSLMLGLANGLLCWAEKTVPSGLAALSIATVPLWMVLLNWTMFAGPRPTARIVLGLLVGLAGVAALVGPSRIGDASVNPWGAAALMGSCLFWSIGSLRSRRDTRATSAFLQTAMQMIGGGAFLMVFSAVVGDYGRAADSVISWKSLFGMAYLVVLGSIVGLSSYIWLLRVCPPAKVATYAYVNPIVAVLLGNLFAGEALTSRSLLAAGLIIPAVVLVTLERRAPRSTEAEPVAEPRALIPPGRSCRPIITGEST